MREAYLQGKRIPELDFFRGFAFVLMFAHHTLFDIRHVFGLDFFPFQDTVWFSDWLRSLILIPILLVSGISCTFSRNNFKRAGQAALYAIGVSIAFALVSFFLQTSMHVYFNIFHLVALSVFLYAIFTYKETDIPVNAVEDWRSLVLFIAGAVCLYLGTAVEKSPRLSQNLWLLFGFRTVDMPPMGDYLPIFPWIGMFFVGAGLGRLFYRTKQSLWPKSFTEKITRWARPIHFIGRHPLLIYAVHQPTILLILWLIFTLTGTIGS